MSETSHVEVHVLDCLCRLRCLLDVFEPCDDCN